MEAIMITLCLLIYIAFIIFDLLPVYFEKQWKVFWVYTTLITVSFIVHTFWSLGFIIPSPAVPLKIFVSYIFKL